MIDGSGSINSIDFQKMKEFVSTVMDQFQKSKTLVRAGGQPYIKLTHVHDGQAATSLSHKKVGFGKS